MKGLVLSGTFGNILVRQKNEEEFQLGELLVGESKQGTMILQVFDLLYGSQISQQNLELVSGMKMEQNADFLFMDPGLRNYTLARIKNLISVKEGKAMVSKTLPVFFSSVRAVTKEDLAFLTKPEHALYIGNLRSGNNVLDVPLYLDGKQVFTHHVLIPATTGRGKSNLMSCILWDTLDKPYCGILVLDPHDEYYGRNKLGLKDHSQHEKVVYYTPHDAPPGARTLQFHLSLIKPHHFQGVVDWSTPQYEALNYFYKKYKENWIAQIMLENNGEGFHEGTIAVVRRRLTSLLDLEIGEYGLEARGIFDVATGKNTIHEIVKDLEEGKTVIVDTSYFSGPVEILIGSLITHEVFKKYKYYKSKGQLHEKPVISIVLEEAPRVLGTDVLEKGDNIFATLAREGRKFQVGLIAITQLPSLIPRQILANMNTKIILGTEMKPERTALIESASQDLSDDDRNIASLDKGEAIISSNFAKFATPVKIPLFSDHIKEQLSQKKEMTQSFAGVKIG
ncbi:ATP-binding protein [Candidatus Woesearchaeota archaeon]|nr:ATP-binding protein [Candidatus Woesearchaeota archaeon]